MLTIYSSEYAFKLRKRGQADFNNNVKRIASGGSGGKTITRVILLIQITHASA